MQLNIEKIKALGGAVLAVSPQTRENSLRTMKKNHVSFHLLSDSRNELAYKFGIVFKIPQELRSVYSSFKIDLCSLNADDSFELPLTATYIIDRDQTIRSAFLDTDYTKRMEPEDISTALAEIKDSNREIDTNSQCK